MSNSFYMWHGTSIFEMGRYSVKLNWIREDKLYGYIVSSDMRKRECVIYNLRNGILEIAARHSLDADSQNEEELALCDIGTWYNQYSQNSILVHSSQTVGAGFPQTWEELNRVQKNTVFDLLHGTASHYLQGIDALNDQHHVQAVHEAAMLKANVVWEDMKPHVMTPIHDDVLNLLLDWKLSPKEITQIIKGKGYSMGLINCDRDIIKYPQGSRHHGVTLRICGHDVSAVQWFCEISLNPTTEMEKGSNEVESASE